MTEGSSASMKQVATTAGSWAEGIIVLVMVLAPIGLAAILVAIGASMTAVWEIVHGTAVNLPTPANIRPYGLLSYAVASWIAVAVAWLWSSHRALSGDVFVFRKLTWSTLTASIVGFLIATYAVPVVTHWLSSVTGDRSQVVRIAVHDPPSVAILVFLFVVTTLVSEEILYRGLLVAWLRRIGWRDPIILLMGSLIFGANHIIPLGYVWGVGMVGLGAILFALRLGYESSRLAGSRSIQCATYPVLSTDRLARTRFLTRLNIPAGSSTVPTRSSNKHRR